MLTNAPEVNSVGGFGGLGIGGWGGGGLIEGLILASVLGRNRGGLFGGDGGGSADLEASGIAAKVVELQNTSNILAELGRHKDCTIGEFRGINAGLFAVNDAIKDGNYAAAIQAERNTNELSTQATAFAVAASREANTNTAVILAKINSDNEQSLRDRIIALEIAAVEERRRHDDEKTTIVNTNNNTNVLTAIQLQKIDTDRKFDTIFGAFSQLNRNTKDIINLGTMTASGTQANSQTNIK